MTAMRRSPARRPQQPEETSHVSFVVAGPGALRVEQEERDRAEAIARRREQREWKRRLRVEKEEEAERARRELQEERRRQQEIEIDGRSKLFETSFVAGAASSSDGGSGASAGRGSDEGAASGPEEEETHGVRDVVLQRIAGRRALAEARQFAAAGGVAAATARFEQGLAKLMPLLRADAQPDPTLREDVMQALDAMERLRKITRASKASAARDAKPRAAAARRREEPYAGDGMSQPWISSYQPTDLSLSSPRGRQSAIAKPEPVVVPEPAGEAEASTDGESLGSLLELVGDLGQDSPLRASRPATADGPASPIRLPATPRASPAAPAASGEQEQAQAYRDAIVSLYRTVNPGAVSELPALFRKYRGREAELWATVCRKYSHDPANTTPGPDAPPQPKPAAELRRSMPLEHDAVAPLPSPELRSLKMRWLADQLHPPPAAEAPGAIQKINVRLSREVPADTLFRALDADGDGVITRREMRQGLRSGAEEPGAAEDVGGGNVSAVGPSMARWMGREGGCTEGVTEAEAAAAAARQPMQAQPREAAAGDGAALAESGLQRSEPSLGQGQYRPTQQWAAKEWAKDQQSTDLAARARELAARVVQRAWSRWRGRLRSKAARWRKELQVLRWRIISLRRDGEEAAAQELEAKLGAIIERMDAVALRELERGEPQRRGGVSAFGAERLPPWNERVLSPPPEGSPRDLSDSEAAAAETSEAFSSGGDESDGSSEGSESWVGGKCEPAASSVKSDRRKPGRRKRRAAPLVLPFSDSEAERQMEDSPDDDEDENYYHNAHDGDIHEFASHLGSFFIQESVVEHAEDGSSYWAEDMRARDPLDLRREERLPVPASSVGPDALMTSLASLEKEVGVGNKRVFRRAVAVLQLHLGALVSGQAEDDGLDTIDHRQPVFEARLGKYPSARLCLRAIGFTKRRGVYSHAGVRGAVAYGDGNVSRGCAARMLQLLGVAAERASAPSAALYRELEQRAMLAAEAQRGTVVQTATVRSRGVSTPGCSPTAELASPSMPPVGWRPPGFTPSTSVLLPAKSVRNPMPPKMRVIPQSPPRASQAQISPPVSAVSSARSTTTVARLAELAQPKSASKPTERRHSARTGAAQTGSSPGEAGSAVDLMAQANEMETGRSLNQRLFVLKDESTPEKPEEEEQEEELQKEEKPAGAKDAKGLAAGPAEGAQQQAPATAAAGSTDGVAASAPRQPIERPEEIQQSMSDLLQR